MNGYFYEKVYEYPTNALASFDGQKTCPFVRTASSVILISLPKKSEPAVV
jgi:hypothetical protein